MTQTGTTYFPQRVEAELLDRLRRLDSCAISDSLDTLGLVGAVTGIGPRWEVAAPMAGRVRTVKAAPKSSAGPAAHIATALVASADQDDVVVIDNHGRTDVSCWGGLLAEAAIQRGIAGVIVDGACRDVQESQAVDLPLFARAAVPVSARGRIVQQSMDEQIQIGGIPVHSGDLVIADWNGVAFIPAAQAIRVIELAERIAQREAGMSQAVRDGENVADVMHDSRFPAVTAQSVEQP